ncbi:MAG: glycerophosphodiester phosphodiesterase [Victivallales bacterium]|nr:glycerophosphodiester phosphodiesterase [Victivallales bacterium]
MDFRHYFDNPFERNVMDIQYSVLADFWGRDDIEGNTELHFRKAIALSFDGLKTDMELTKDGEIVLCHDPGFTLDADGRIVAFNEANYVAFREMTLEQVLALEFARTENGLHYHPCTLNTMLSLCRENNLAAYLTLRPEPWRNETATRMAELILANDMQRQTIINLYPGSKEAMDFVSSLIPGMVYCNTREPQDELTTKLIDDSAADGYNIICMYRKQIDTVTPDVFRYAASKGIHVWAWEVTTEQEVAEYIAKGVTGFQMFTRDVTVSVIKDILSKLPPTL